MPRLVGKQSNEGTYLGLVLIALVAAFGVLEYSGAIDVVPNFGQEKVYFEGSRENDLTSDSVAN